MDTLKCDHLDLISWNKNYTFAYRTTVDGTNLHTDIIIIASTEMMQNWHYKAKRKTQVASVRKALNL